MYIIKLVYKKKTFQLLIEGAHPGGGGTDGAQALGSNHIGT